MWITQLNGIYNRLTCKYLSRLLKVQDEKNHPKG